MRFTNWRYHGVFSTQIRMTFQDSFLDLMEGQFFADNQLLPFADHLRKQLQRRRVAAMANGWSDYFNRIYMFLSKNLLPQLDDLMFGELCAEHQIVQGITGRVLFDCHHERLDGNLFHILNLRSKAGLAYLLVHTDRFKDSLLVASERTSRPTLLLQHAETNVPLGQLFVLVVSLLLLFARNFAEHVSPGVILF